MSKENDQLLIAYFPSKETAEQAAHELKEWDKTYAKIKLGAMGVVSLGDDGHVSRPRKSALAPPAKGLSGACWPARLPVFLPAASAWLAARWPALPSVPSPAPCSIAAWA